MWKDRKDEGLSQSMEHVLNISAQARTTIGMLLVDCTTEEIVEVLMKYSGVAGYYHKTIMMRKELARRNPEYAKLKHNDIPIEMVFAWEIACRPFRELSRKKQERINHEKFEGHLERLTAGMDAGKVS